MAMLADPKRKQKWTLNPRGKQWSEDSNKFGQKLLEKMGWSSGKGLGAQEQGMVEHVRVKVKNDQVGIGFDKNRDDHWTEHQDVFNNLLENLQKEQSTDTVEITEDKNKGLSGKSLEEISKLSQKRVHYKKFTRGKDVNKYSTKDLANIFGKKDLNEKPIKEEKIEEEEKVYDPVGTKDTTAGILTIKGGNMQDYFKKKFYSGEQNGTIEDRENSESETEKRVGFGFSGKSKSTFYVNGDVSLKKEDSDSGNERYTGFGFSKSSESKSKNKKLTNLNYVFDNPCLDLNILDDNSPIPRKIKTENVDSECTEKVTPRKRKSEFIYENEGLDLKCPDRPAPKKRKSEFTYENEGLDLEYSDNVTAAQQENFETTCENKSSHKKIKKIKSVPLSNGYESPRLELEFPDKPTSKKMKDEPLSNGYENPALDLDSPDRPTPKKIKKIKCEPALTGYENPGLDLEVSDRSTPKKIKKEKESEVLSNGIENSALDLEFPNRPTTKKFKKEKESEVLSNGIENPALDLEFPDRPTPKKIKKEKESEVLSNGIENPALNLEFPDRPTPKKSKKSKKMEVLPNGIKNPGLDLEFPDTPTPKKPKKSKENQMLSNGIENPALDLEFPDTPTPKKSKKSKDNQVLSNGIANPALDLKFPDTPTPKKSKKSKENQVLSNGIENPALDLEFPDTPTPKKSKKSKENQVLSNGIVNPVLDLEFSDTPTPKKSKKSKEIEVSSSGLENPALDLNYPINEVYITADFEVSRATCGLENNALDLSDENSSKKRVTFSDHVEYNTDIVKKKKKKRKLDKYEVVSEKLKKQSVSVEPAIFVNEGLDVEEINEEEIDNELNERKSKKCKRRKEQRMLHLETIQEAPEEENSNETFTLTEGTVEEDNKDIEIIGQFPCEEIQEIPNDNTPKKKHKKRKDKQKSKEISTTIEEIDITNEKEKEIDNSEEPVEIIDEKRKKKKGAKTEIIEDIKSEIRTNNPGKENVCSDKDEVANAVCKKEKKKKKKSSDEDVVSLEEFLNEESTPEKRPKLKKQSVEPETSTIESKETEVDNGQSSFQKYMKTKQVMKSLFIKNPTLLFNGSNINEIKGYGSHVQNNY